MKRVQEALKRAVRLFEEALPKFDWGKSALDANAIQLLNEVPGEVRAVLNDWPPEPESRHTIDRVTEFHAIFKHPIADAPTPATKALRELRVRLIAEELTELCEALGVAVKIESNGVSSQFVVEAVKDDGDVDLVEAADALGDLDYVVQGANLVFGFPAEDVVREIHRANMSKLGEDGKPIYREDGKVVKGPNYTPPNVAAVLSEATGTDWAK
ncbi:nucleotide pyrophosphohydrolase [Bordetella phage MW2]|uniref:Nucleotide pyrophosphohydrolase n=1 Tax=Bordetella phage MW2 TaxID=1916126 RepID=A0A2D0W971_9CAUD|nr:nucleotide pyrophosphohydrolase [Bordetella phage MW2]APL99190.1 nucleotide pyrophosphohydrolase [Bordetella phage MW2]